MSADRVICIVDDDEAIRDSLRLLLGLSGYKVETFERARDFLNSKMPASCACVVTDIRMPDMDGLELQRALKERASGLPVIIMTGHGDVPLAVRAMKEGASDFLEKPFAEDALLASISAALERSGPKTAHPASEKVEQLTPREREVFDLIVDGNQNKMIAHKLGISVRTVEVYRGRIMEKMQARTVAELVRLALAAKG